MDYITVVLPENLDKTKSREIELSISDKVAAEDELENAEIFRIVDYRCVKNRMHFGIASDNRGVFLKFIDDTCGEISGIKVFVDDGMWCGDKVYEFETDGKELVFIKEFDSWAEPVEGFIAPIRVEYNAETGEHTIDGNVI